MYVVKIDAQSNTIVLGGKDNLLSDGLLATDVNWLIDVPAEPFEAKVKIRYNHRAAPAVVYPQGKGESVRVEFTKPISAITPGQAAVFYIARGDELRVAGGGWISSDIKYQK
jgi:tRNA-specific 2-thiouridylase